VAGLLQMLVLFAGVCLSERDRGGEEAATSARIAFR